MSYDKLKKLGGGTGSYKYENPYTKKKEPQIGPTKAEVDEKHRTNQSYAEQSILDQNNYMFSQMHELKREVEDLKFDIVSLLMMIEEGDGELFKISAQAMREKYFKFRASKKHVLSRIIDKTETIIKKDLNFNDTPNSDE